MPDYTNSTNRSQYNQAPRNNELTEQIMTFTDESYVDEAESVIKEFAKLNFKYQRSNERRTDELTTSQIRNLLTLTSNIYDETKTKEFSQLLDKFSYLRIQFVYQSGRNRAVEYLVKRAGIIHILTNKVNDNKSLIRFCRYMEALVAYFKYYGGAE